MDDRCDYRYGTSHDDDTVTVRFGKANYEHTEWFYLPHQCDSWVIGNTDQVRELITDLQTALKN